MKLKQYIGVLIFGMLIIPQLLCAQVNFNKTPDDDLGNIEDNYQEYFFEGLKQKGIENYDKSIKAFLKCVELNDEEPAAYFQLGKNYVQLKNFGAAEDALKEAISKDEDNEWYLDELYGVYYQMDDFDKALKTVKQLVKFHPDYKEDLAALYFKNRRYKAALKVLDELNKDYGQTESRDFLRNKIYNATGDDDERIEYLEERIAINPDNESNYLNLIYRYSEQDEKKKAYETALKLLQNNPESHMVHLALYKFYLDDNKTEQAISSMTTVLKSTRIKPDAKTKVLNDFVDFVKRNPEYESALLDVTTDVAGDKSGKSSAELGQYYLQKGEKEKALANFKNAIKEAPNNFELLKNVLLLEIDLNQYEAAVELSRDALETFPAQPILYLANGVANNKLNRYKEAISSLEMGVDYVIDNTIMEIDFYKQLSAAYRLSNNIPKSQAFAKKAEALSKNQ